MRALWVMSSVALCAAPARADELRADATSTMEPAPGRHLFYAELLGKGGLYGVGYELALTPRLSLGTAASFAVVRDQQLLTVAPYVHATLLRGKKNALFGELGPVLVHSRIPSPVDDWDGMSESGVGGFASLGWERATRHLVFRTSGSIVAGEGGVTPWLGFAIGFRP